MPPDPERCDVCGRTILKGELVHEYVTAQGDRVEVCSLCRTRAESSGWIPAERYGTVPQAPPNRVRRGEALRRRLGQAASRARRGAGLRPADAPADEEATPPPEAEPRAKEPAPKERPKQRPQPQAKGRAPRQAKPRAPRQAKPKPKEQHEPARPRRRKGPEAIMRRAVERFNGSGEPRKVAGLIRSLGEPQAAVRPDAQRQLALVTVAWELSWYQWEVRENGEAESVREIAKGKEVSELSEEARAWNAAVAEDGSLRLRSASARRKQSGKQA